MDGVKVKVILDVLWFFMGMDIFVIDLINIESFFSCVVFLFEYCQSLYIYLCFKMS